MTPVAKVIIPLTELIGLRTEIRTRLSKVTGSQTIFIKSPTEFKGRLSQIIILRTEFTLSRSKISTS